MHRALPFICLMLALPATTTLACLNDRETAVVEAEFRSRYESPSNPGTGTPASPESTLNVPVTQWSPMGVGMSAAGILLIAGSIPIARRKLALPEKM